MATSNNTISLTGLDFDTYKANLKNFLRSQTAFKDYDFEGSNMNALLSVLAYNAYLQGFLANMAVSEAFLDSAQTRNSVVSRAMELNYLPKSMQSSEAIIDVTIPTSNAITITIPKGTPFGGRNTNGNYVFSTAETVVLTSGNNTFQVNNLKIFEGSYSQEAYVVDTTDDGQKFVLSNAGVDIDSISVVVTENLGAQFSQYNRATSLFGVGPASNVFFIETSLDNKYQIVFGDGVLGYRPKNGATVAVEYRSTAGPDADSIDTFSLDVDLGPLNNTQIISGLVVTTVQSSTGGGNIESITSIKKNAPRHFQTQERAVIPSDYEQLVLENFSDVGSVHAYGGEQVIGLSGSVDYGKVYVACSSKSGTALTSVRKDTIVSFLKTRAVQSITPVMADPDYTYLNLSVKIHVDFSKTSLSSNQVQTAVQQAIASWNDNNLKQFNADFRFSQLTSTINQVDPSVISNEIDVVLYKLVEPMTGQKYSINLAFSTKIMTLLTNKFSVEGKVWIFTDTITGVTTVPGALYMVEQNPALSVPNYRTAGAIDYTNGIVTINSLVYDQVSGTGIKFYAVPVNQDIYASMNQILEIDTSTGVNISVING
jgi:hypothetical protein